MQCLSLLKLNDHEYRGLLMLRGARWDHKGEVKGDLGQVCSKLLEVYRLGAPCAAKSHMLITCALTERSKAKHCCKQWQQQQLHGMAMQRHSQSMQGWGAEWQDERTACQRLVEDLCQYGHDWGQVRACKQTAFISDKMLSLGLNLSSMRMEKLLFAHRAG